MNSTLHNAQSDIQIFDFEYLDDDLNVLAGVDEVGRGPLAGPVVAGCALLRSSDQVSSSPLNLLEAKSLLAKLSECGITDSKKLSEKKRQRILSALNIQLPDFHAEFESDPLWPKNLGQDQGPTLLRVKKWKVAETKDTSLWVNVVEIQAFEIDRLNILYASQKAMFEAYRGLAKEKLSGPTKRSLLIDGNQTLPHKLTRDCEVMSATKQVAVVKGDQKSLLIGLASVVAKEYRDHWMKYAGSIYPGYGLENHAGYPTKAHKEAISKLGVCALHRKSFKGVREFVNEQRENF